MRLYIYLTPCIPLSIIWRCILCMRGKDSMKRGYAPLKLPIRLFLPMIWIYIPIMRENSF